MGTLTVEFFKQPGPYDIDSVKDKGLAGEERLRLINEFFTSLLLKYGDIGIKNESQIDPSVPGRIVVRDVPEAIKWVPRDAAAFVQTFNWQP